MQPIVIVLAALLVLSFAANLDLAVRLYKARRLHKSDNRAWAEAYENVLDEGRYYYDIVQHIKAVLPHYVSERVAKQIRRDVQRRLRPPQSEVGPAEAPVRQYEDSDAPPEEWD